MIGVTLPSAKSLEGQFRSLELLHGAKEVWDHETQPPPKADENLAHSRYLPRMSKNSLLRALCDSVVIKGLWQLNQKHKGHMG
jgi:hypothetical protein